MRQIIALTILLASGSFSLAAEPATQPAGTPESQANAIAPFLDELTMVVLRWDIAELDIEAYTQYYRHCLELAVKDPAKVKEAMADPGKKTELLKRAVADFRQAGGRDVYFVFSMADMMAKPMPIFAVAPLATDARPQAVSAAFELFLLGMNSTSSQLATQPAGSRPSDDIRTVEFRGAIVSAPQRVLQRLRMMQEPSTRPQLKAALEAVQGYPLQALLVPLPDMMRVYAAMVPGAGAPHEQQMREPIQTILRNFEWMAIGGTISREPSLKAVWHAAGPKGAQAIHDAMETLGKAAIQRHQTEGEKEDADAARIILELLPAPSGDQLVLTLNGSQLDKFVAQQAPSLFMAREQAKKRFSQNNLAQIGRAIHIYEGTYKGQWPSSLREIVEKGRQTPYDPSMDLLANPQRPNMKPAYIYIKPAMPSSKIPDPGQLVVVYEAYDKWDAGINILLLDGHVKFITDEAEFQKMMTLTKALNAAGAALETPATQPAETE